MGGVAVSFSRDGVLRFLWCPAEETKDFVFLIQQTFAIEDERDYVISVACRDATGAMLKPAGERLRWSTVLDSYFIYPSKKTGVLSLSWSGNAVISEVEVRVAPWRKKQHAAKVYGVAVIGVGSKPRDYEVLPVLGEDRS